MEEKSLLVDTGAWYALADRSDQHHNQAVDIYPELLRSYHHLTTTNLGIAETYILVRRAVGHQEAITFLDNIAASIAFIAFIYFVRVYKLYPRINTVILSLCRY